MGSAGLVCRGCDESGGDILDFGPGDAWHARCLGTAAAQTVTCPVPGCGRTVGPYYAPAEARAALADHTRQAHSAVWSSKGAGDV